MVTIALIAAVGYILRTIGFLFGAGRAARPARIAGELPFVSVIVAARDEEKNIGRCLESLAKQTYPAEQFEVLVMNDGSTDRTEAIVQSFTARFPNIRCLPVHKEDSHLRGKARAVAQGIDAAIGEIFSTTDADCRVSPRWLEEAVKYFTPRTGLVAGFTLQESRSMFEGMQALDWGFLLTMASASFGLRKPLGCIGNNLFFRREAYQHVGGYRGFTFSITEDLALLQAIERTGNWEYKYPVNPAMLVFSEPCSDLASLWKQKRRWGMGGKHLGPRGYVMLVTSTLMNGSILVSLLTGNWFAFFGAVIVRWSADFILLSPSLVRLGVSGMLRFFPVYEVYAILYEFALPFGIMKKNVEWKGRTFS